MSKKGRRGKKKNHRGNNRDVVHTNTAPTMQGMQQTGSWVLRQLVPVTINPGYDPSEPAVVQF